MEKLFLIYMTSSGLEKHYCKCLQKNGQRQQAHPKIKPAKDLYKKHILKKQIKTSIIFHLQNWLKNFNGSTLQC